MSARDAVASGPERQPSPCMHCGRVPAPGRSVVIGTGTDGQRLIACIPVCPPRGNTPQETT